MTQTSLLIMEHTLSYFVTLIIYHVNTLGEEKMQTFKTTKKKLMAQLKDMEVNATLVDNFPTKMEDDVFYVKRNGKTVWVREVEKGDNQ